MVTSVESLLFRDAALTSAFAYASKQDLPLVVSYDGHTWKVFDKQFEEAGKVPLICYIFKCIVHALRKCFSTSYSERYIKTLRIFEEKYKLSKADALLDGSPVKTSEPSLSIQDLTLQQKNYTFISQFDKGKLGIENDSFVLLSKKPTYDDELQKKIVAKIKEAYQAPENEHRSFADQLKFIKGLEKIKKKFGYIFSNSILELGIAELLPLCEKNLKCTAIIDHKFGMGYQFDKSTGRLLLTKAQASFLDVSDQTKLANICKELLEDKSLAEHLSGQLFTALNQLLLSAFYSGFEQLYSELTTILLQHNQLDPTAALVEAQRNSLADHCNKLKIILNYQGSEKSIAIDNDQLHLKKSSFTTNQEIQIVPWIKKQIEDFWKTGQQFPMTLGYFIAVGEKIYAGLQKMAKRYQHKSLANDLITIYKDLEKTIQQKKAELTALSQQSTSHILDLLKIGETEYDATHVNQLLKLSYGRMPDQILGKPPTSEKISRAQLFLMLSTIETSLKLRT